MEIEFYYKDTGIVIPKHEAKDWFFVYKNTVYCDAGMAYESQSAVVSFGDCIINRPDIGWRVVEVKE